MKSSLSICALALFAWALSGGVLPAAAQVAGQPNGNSGANSGTGNNANRNASIPPSNRSATPDNSPQFQRQTLLFITGSVLLEDGTPPPTGAVVESNCGMSTTKQAYVSIDGSFSFQVGDPSPANVIPDAANPGPGFGDPFGPMNGSRSLLQLNNCELSARMPGYRSTVVHLSADQEMGNVMAGTIFLYPASRVTGTTVNMNDLTAPREARKEFDKAEKALRKNKFDEAEQNFGKAVAVCPKYASAWFRLGQLFARDGNTEKAREAYIKASEIDSKFVNPILALAKLAAGQSDWRKTRELTTRAIELDPINFPESYFYNAVAAFNLNDREAAEKSVRKALLLDSRHQNPREFLLLAEILGKKQDAAGQAEQLRSFLKYAPQDPDAPGARTELGKLEQANPTIAARRH